MIIYEHQCVEILTLKSIAKLEVKHTFRKRKIHLLCLMRPEYESVFNIYDPKGIKYLFQLRMSPLR